MTFFALNNLFTVMFLQEEINLLFEQEGIAEFLDKLDLLYLEQKLAYGTDCTCWLVQHL